MKQARKAKISLIIVAAIMLIIAISYVPTTAATAPTEVPSEYLIVPGQRIGNYTLDRTMESYIQEFGSPEIVRLNIVGLGSNLYQWPSRGIAIWTRNNVIVQINIVTRALGRAYAERDPQVVAIQRRLEQYRTAKGLSLGQSVARVRELYGEPELFPIGERDQFHQDGFVYRAIGLWITIESRVTPGTVISIGVFRAGTPRWW